MEDFKGQKELEKKFKKAQRILEKEFKMPLSERLNKYFIEHLEKFNFNNEIKDLAKEIKWDLIINIFQNELNVLWDKFVIPKKLGKIVEKGLKSGFYSMVIGNNLFTIYYYLIKNIEEQIKLNKSKEELNNNIIKEELNNNIIKYLGDIIRINLLQPYFFQLSLTNMNESNNQAFTIVKMEKLKEYAKQGKKFVTKKEFNPKEIPLFERIIKEYEEAIQSGLKKPYTTIAYYIAKNELNYKTKKEQNKFYKRMLAFKKSKQK